MSISTLHIFLVSLTLLISGELQAGQSLQDLSGYRLAAFEITGETAFPPDKLIAEFPIRAGDTFDNTRIKEGLESIRHLFEEAGYIDFTYIPSFNCDEKAKTVAVSLNLWQGEQYYIHRITFSGDLPESDREIRASMSALGLVEGQIFRPSLLDRAVKSLNRMYGEERLTSKDCEFTKSAEPFARVDITFRLPKKTP